MGQHRAIPHQPLLGRCCSSPQVGACFGVQIWAMLSRRVLQKPLCCLLRIIGRALSCNEARARLLLCWRLQLLQSLAPVAALLAEGAQQSTSSARRGGRGADWPQVESRNLASPSYTGFSLEGSWTPGALSHGVCKRGSAHLSGTALPVLMVLQGCGCCCLIQAILIFS